MKIGITDNQGRLGKVLSEWYPRVDLVDAHKYDVIVHNGAYTDVDGAEKNMIEALTKNVFLTQRLRLATEARIIYLSTDFIFDGRGGPYHENAIPKPLSVYGWSKWMGERVLHNTDTIVRTTVLYGGHKPDFVAFVLNNLKDGIPFQASVRMITSPTNVHHLAEAIRYLIENGLYPSIINVAGNNIVSRYAFACEIATVFGYSMNDVGYTNKTDFGIAKRPERAGLKTSLAKRLGIPIYSIQEGLEKMKNDNI